MTKTIFKIKIERKIHQLDAAGQAPGRLGTKISGLLVGKNKVTYSPQVDNGDFVVVSNVDKMKFTGKKLEQKKYYSYSGYPGGLKTKKIGVLYKENPQQILKFAVWKMLPKNRLRKAMFKRLSFKK